MTKARLTLALFLLALTPAALSQNAQTTMVDAAFLGGVDFSAGASTNPGANFTAEIDFDRELSGPSALALDAPVWISGYVRLASIAQPGAISSSTTLTSYVSPAVNASSVDLVQSGEMLVSLDFWPWKGHLGGLNTPIKVMLTASGGAITPLSSAPSSPTVYVVSQALYSYYAANPTDPNAKAVTTSCGSSFSTTVPCYVAFVPEDRTSFFRDWSAGVKFKNYCYSGTAHDQYPFPGITTATIGQNEFVTGGSMRGFVLHIATLQPVPSNVAGSLSGYLYFFGSMDMVVRRRIAYTGAPQFSLSTAGSSITPNSSNVAEVSVAQPNRDRYRFGLGLDLVKLISLIKNKT